MADKPIDQRVKDIIVEQLGVKPDQVTPEAKFIEDLGADSLDTVELVMALEEEFGIEVPDEQAEKLQSVGDVIKYIEDAPEIIATSNFGAVWLDSARTAPFDFHGKQFDRTPRRRHRPGRRHAARTTTSIRSGKTSFPASAALTRSPRFDASPFDTQIAGEVKNFDPDAGVSLAQGNPPHGPLLAIRRLCRVAGVEGFRPGPGKGKSRRNRRHSSAPASAAWQRPTEQHKILLERGPGRLSPFMIPMLISQHGVGLVLDVFQFARAELRHLLRLRHRQPRHRRSLAHHQDGRRAGHVRRRRGSDGRAHRHRRLLRDARHEHAQ